MTWYSPFTFCSGRPEFDAAPLSLFITQQSTLKALARVSVSPAGVEVRFKRGLIE